MLKSLDPKSWVLVDCKYATVVVTGRAGNRALVKMGAFASGLNDRLSRNSEQVEPPFPLCRPKVRWGEWGPGANKKTN